MRFVDADVLILFFVGEESDVPENREKARAARRLISRVEGGVERIRASHTVLFEVVFVLLRSYRVPEAEARAALAALLALEGLEVPDKERFLRALDLFAETPLSIVDSLNVLDMRSLGVQEIYAFDKGYDRLPDITRVDVRGEG